MVSFVFSHEKRGHLERRIYSLKLEEREWIETAVGCGRMEAAVRISFSCFVLICPFLSAHPTR
jgi:hypothetical protein